MTLNQGHVVPCAYDIPAFYVSFACHMLIRQCLKCFVIQLCRKLHIIFSETFTFEVVGILFSLPLPSLFSPTAMAYLKGTVHSKKRKFIVFLLASAVYLSKLFPELQSCIVLKILPPVTCSAQSTKKYIRKLQKQSLFTQIITQLIKIIQKLGKKFHVGATKVVSVE